MISFSLNDVGYELITASDGKEALQQFRKHRPDIIILDVMMPGGMSGLDVCKKIKEDSGTESKIIIVSALSQSVDVVVGHAAGADSYLTKPFSPTSLLREINRVTTSIDE